MGPARSFVTFEWTLRKLKEPSLDDGMQMSIAKMKPSIEKSPTLIFKSILLQ